MIRDGRDDAAPLRVTPSPAVPSGDGAGMPPPGAGVDLRLDGNQGSAPSPSFWRDLGQDTELLRAYPAGRELEAALAERHGVASDRIVVTAGADEVLDRVCRAVLAPGREAVLPVPTFEMLERYAALTGAAVVRVPWVEGDWPRAPVLAATSERTALVAIVSPNNPTGLCATAADLTAVVDAVPRALVLVDAAYGEYAADDWSQAALSRPNAVLVRTFSKAQGLAGLRVGYAIAHPEVARWLRTQGSPFTAGRLARAAAALRLRTGSDEVAAHVAAVRGHRQVLGQLLAELGARPLPSQANFVFARAAAPELLRDLLAALGIAVRAFNFANLPSLPGGVRITVPGDAASFARLLAALRAALQPGAFVLDLDGVLADVEGRRSLVDAAALAALAAVRPLAVVTGCPRRLCESLLERYGFRSHIATSVCAEDGPGKPDPFPVRLALQRLGAVSAWMLGDNVSDVQAARAAAVVPFALAPADDVEAARLRGAGAARLLGSISDLGPLLANVRGATPTATSS